MTQEIPDTPSEPVGVDADAPVAADEGFAHAATEPSQITIEADGSGDVLDRVLERTNGDVTVIVVNS